MGYAEARVRAKEWKATGSLSRPWQTATPRKGLTGEPLFAWARSLAKKYPKNVKA